MTDVKSSFEYLKKNPDAVAKFFSGGQGSDEDISSEAQCMENVLVKLGIEQSRLYKEDKSTSTSQKILRFQRLLSRKTVFRKVFLSLQNEFHMNTEQNLSAIKTDLISIHHAVNRHFYTLITYHTREMAALLKELITKIVF